MQVKILHDTPKYKKDETPHLRVETGRSLCDLGYAEPYTEPLQPAVVSWSVSRDELSGRVVLRASCSRNCAHYAFHGDSSLLRLEKYAFFHCAQPETVPLEVITRYDAMRKGGTVPDTTVSDTERASNRAAKEADRKESARRERAGGRNYEGSGRFNV